MKKDLKLLLETYDIFAFRQQYTKSLFIEINQFVKNTSATQEDLALIVMLLNSDKNPIIMQHLGDKKELALILRNRLLDIIITYSNYMQLLKQIIGSITPELAEENVSIQSNKHLIHLEILLIEFYCEILIWNKFNNELKFERIFRNLIETPYLEMGMKNLWNFFSPFTKMFVDCLEINVDITTRNHSIDLEPKYLRFMEKQISYLQGSQFKKSLNFHALAGFLDSAFQKIDPESKYFTFDYIISLSFKKINNLNDLKKNLHGIEDDNPIPILYRLYLIFTYIENHRSLDLQFVTDQKQLVSNELRSRNKISLEESNFRKRINSFQRVTSSQQLESDLKYLHCINLQEKLASDELRSRQQIRLPEQLHRDELGTRHKIFVEEARDFRKYTNFFKQPETRNKTKDLLQKQEGSKCTVLNNRDFLINSKTLLENVSNIIELMDIHTKQTSYANAVTLVQKLGGTIEDNTGSSHHKIMFPEKNSSQQKCVGTLVKPHGRSKGNVVEYLNLRLFKESIARVLPLDWKYQCTINKPANQKTGGA